MTWEIVPRKVRVGELSFEKGIDAMGLPGNPRRNMLELVVSRLGRQEVARILGVPLVILDDWLSGETLVPDPKALSVFDLVERNRALRGV